MDQDGPAAGWPRLYTGRAGSQGHTGQAGLRGAGDSLSRPVPWQGPHPMGQWSTELYTVQKDCHNGVYKVDNNLYPRKEIQLVKGPSVSCTQTHVQGELCNPRALRLGGASHPAAGGNG